MLETLSICIYLTIDFFVDPPPPLYFFVCCMHCWDLDVRLNYWIELNWQAPRQQRCRDACQISERYDHYNIQSRGFKTSRSCDNTSYRLVSRGPISQIPEYSRQKSDNAPFCNRNVHISVTKCCIVGYGIDAFWDLWDGSIVQSQHKIQWNTTAPSQFSGDDLRWPTEYHGSTVGGCPLPGTVTDVHSLIVRCKYCISGIMTNAISLNLYREILYVLRKILTPFCASFPPSWSTLNRNGLCSMYYMFTCFWYFVRTLCICFDSRRCIFILGSSPWISV